MDTILTDLADQREELSGLLDGLNEDDWQAPTRCTGWDVADVVLHLAQTDELAIASASGRYVELTTAAADRYGPTASVDAGAALLVERERGVATAHLHERWSTGAARLLEVLEAMDLSTRVTWVAGELSARTLATTRLAETWIHAGDVADAIGTTLAATDRLRPIARLAWRTLPYAFATAGRSMGGPVAFILGAPNGATWEFEPDDPPLTTIRGAAADLCAVAARRVEASATSLRGSGPDAGLVLALVRTYA